MAFGDVYKTAWRNKKGEQVEIVEGSGSDGPCFAICHGHNGEPSPTRAKSLDAARALTALEAWMCGWHADMTAEIGLFDKDGHALPDPDEQGEATHD